MKLPSELCAPAVSIVIPAFRASGDIPDALASVFRQTFTDFETIVVNDGSPDTQELERVLSRYASQIRYITQPNRGAAAARNAGVRASRGALVAFLDADDVWMPEFLERQVQVLREHADCALVYCDALITGDTQLARRRFSESAPSEEPVTLLKLLEQRCNIMLSTVVVRREPLLASGGFDETLRRGHDADLWFRLASRGAGLRYQPLVLAERRVRADGLSGDRMSELTRAIDVLGRFDQQGELPPAERTALRVRLAHLRAQLDIEEAKRQLVAGDFGAARDHLRRHWPVSLKIRAALVALRVAPHLFRRVYLAMRRKGWTPTVERRVAISGEAS